MAQLWVNAIEGALDAQLNNGSTTISGLFLADLPAVSGSDYVVLTIDPDSAHDDPEIVHVTAHTASATTATILRAQESTTEPATPWPLGTAVAATVTKASLDALDSAIAANAAGVTQAGNDLNEHESGVNHDVATPSSKGMMSNTDKAKLDGIEANAKDDQAISAGSGITVTGSGDVSIAHADTSTHGSVNNSGSVVIQDLYIDDFGHATNINAVNITPALIGAQPTLTDMDPFIQFKNYTATSATLPALTSNWANLHTISISRPSGWGSSLVIAWADVQYSACPDGLQLNCRVQIDSGTGASSQSGSADSTDGTSGVAASSASAVVTTSDSTINVNVQGYGSVATGGIGKFSNVKVILVRAS